MTLAIDNRTIRGFRRMEARQAAAASDGAAWNATITRPIRLHYVGRFGGTLDLHPGDRVQLLEPEQCGCVRIRHRQGVALVEVDGVFADQEEAQAA